MKVRRSLALMLAAILAISAGVVVAPAAFGAPRCLGAAATIVGTDGDDDIEGTRRRDVIVTRRGSDIVNGRGGGDVICTGGDDDFVRGGAGNDLILTGGSSDTAHGGEGRDHISTGAGALDALFGGAGDDTLSGGPGSFDGLTGGEGDDLLDGGAGLDIAYFFDAPNGVEAELLSGLVTGHGTDQLTDVEGLVGSNHDDVLLGDDGSNLLSGQGGDDRIEARGSGPVGTPDADVLDGGDGDDVLDGGEGGDFVRYEDSPSGVTVDLAAGIATGWGTDDLIAIEAAIGSVFDDTLLGDGGDNAFVPGPGDDAVDGRAGIDEVVYVDALEPIALDLAAGTSTGWGTDALVAIENARGTAGADTLAGDDGPNVLVGGSGADALEGAGGDDTLLGAGGTDTADGGAGDDACDAETETTCERALGDASGAAWSSRSWSRDRGRPVTLGG